MPDVEVFDVPGAFELPLAARYAARIGRFAGVACLGAVIRGETDHYDFVCAEAARGIMQVQLRRVFRAPSACSPARPWSRRSRARAADKRDQGRHAAEARAARWLRCGTAAPSCARAEV